MSDQIVAQWSLKEDGQVHVTGGDLKGLTRDQVRQLQFHLLSLLPQLDQLAVERSIDQDGDEADYRMMRVEGEFLMRITKKESEAIFMEDDLMGGGLVNALLLGDLSFEPSDEDEDEDEDEGYEDSWDDDAEDDG